MDIKRKRILKVAVGLTAILIFLLSSRQNVQFLYASVQRDAVL